MNPPHVEHRVEQHLGHLSRLQLGALDAVRDRLAPRERGRGGAVLLQLARQAEGRPEIDGGVRSAGFLCKWQQHKSGLLQADALSRWPSLLHQHSSCHAHRHTCCWSR